MALTLNDELLEQLDRLPDSEVGKLFEAMTPEERTQLSGFIRERRGAKTQQGAAVSAPTEGSAPSGVGDEGVSGMTALGRGAAQGATFGFADEINGLVQALGTKYLPESMGGGGEQAQARSIADLYRQNRDVFRRENQAASDQQGGLYLLGNVAGGLPAGIAMGGGGGGATLRSLMGSGAKAGLSQGAAYGAGASNADVLGGDVAGFLKDAAALGLAGGAIGGAAPVVGTGLGWLGRNVVAPVGRFIRGGYVTPTPEAQRLTAQGVNLTLGQMDPKSAFGRIEELASNGVMGGSLNAARQEAANSARDALIARAGAPGVAPPTRGLPVGQQLDELRAGYGQLYDQALEGAKLNPDVYLGQGKWRGLMTDEAMTGSAKVKGAFELAAGARNIDASPAVRRRALEWLADKAKSLNPTKSGPNAGTVDARSIHSLRTQLRDKIRGLGDEGDDRNLREIYGRAEEFVTELLEGQLPAEKAGMLRAADSSYRNLLSVEDAARRAFVQNEEFTPAQLLQAIRSKGATPELRGLARDAQGVLSARYPPTGLQVAANESIWGLKKIGPAWAALANASPALRAHALRGFQTPQAISLMGRGLAPVSRGLQAVPASQMTQSATMRTLADMIAQQSRPALTLSPEEEEFQKWAAAQ